MASVHSAQSTDSGAVAPFCPARAAMCRFKCGRRRGTPAGGAGGFNRPLRRKRSEPIQDGSPPPRCCPTPSCPSSPSSPIKRHNRAPSSPSSLIKRHNRAPVASVATGGNALPSQRKRSRRPDPEGRYPSASEAAGAFRRQTSPISSRNSEGLPPAVTRRRSRARVQAT